MRTGVLLFLLGTLWGVVSATESRKVASGHGGQRSMALYIKRTTHTSDAVRLSRVRRAADDTQPDIRSLLVVSEIKSRFCTTVMESDIYNSAVDDTVATFKIMLPDTAFMSNFTMLIDGDLFIAEVKSKEDAEKLFEDAQERNETAGMVSSDDDVGRDVVPGMDKFKVSVNIAGEGSALFTLTYMELLQRRLGMYEHKISVRPQQIVDNLHINVFIFEPQEITVLEVIEPYGSNSLETLDTDIMDVSSSLKEIFFHPSKVRQKEKELKNDAGLRGDFIVRYDVQHNYDAGLILVEGDYFAHFFSPSGDELEPLPKNIVFVIDISGSMGGTKIEQTRASMLVILDQLRPMDKFMIVLFDDAVVFWPQSRDLVEATSSNIDNAKEYVLRNVHADGSTNINSALVSAAESLNSAEQFGANMIIFLTDGEPSAGVTSTPKILENVARATRGRVSIFSLGFGYDMNYDLLRAISFRNNGFTRRIFDDVNAEVQLKTFFEEVGTVELYDVKIILPQQVISVTQTEFPQYFRGSEIVVTGKFGEVPSAWNMQVTAIADGPVQLSKPVTVQDNVIQLPQANHQFQPRFLERLYVYLKIKDQLRLQLMTDNEDEQEELENYALQLALEYHLVTPLTSFIIVQEQDTPDYYEEDHMVYTSFSSFGGTARNTAAPGVIVILCMWINYYLKMIF